MERNSIAIGMRIRSIRERLGMTTEQFAESFDPPASKGTVSKWENGHYLPNNQRLVKISQLGDITVNELLYGDPKSYLNNLLWETSLLDDFSSVTFDKFYDSLVQSNTDDLYLSEEEAVRRYKIFGEQNKQEENIIPLGANIYQAYEHSNEAAKLFLNEAENHYTSLFGLSFKDAFNDSKKQK